MAVSTVNPGLIRFIGNQFETKGFVGDLASGFKLANFFTESLYGATSELSGRISSFGAIAKNYFDAISVPASAADIGRDWEVLVNGRGDSVQRHFDGPVRRVAEFVSSNLTFWKNLFGAGELANKVLGEEFVSKETLRQYSPISGFATLAFAGNQIVFENAPELVAQASAGNTGKATSVFLKLVKHVSLAAVGALALVAAFYAPIPAIAIPAFLTVALVASVVGRFFDGLVLASGSRRGPIQEEPAANSSRIAMPPELVDMIRELKNELVENKQFNASQFQQLTDLLNVRLPAQAGE